ncbi:MAG: winged helix-turn-helix domain-containing protein [Phycisphaerae bacterium]|nr:winged helix-turn-helix domain-containing protein [Phycisphaerae bacterium]
MAKSRRTDPVTSHQAAHEVEKSGRAASHRAMCLASVNMRPGQTAAEIAVHTGLERHAPSRRLPELRDQGLIANGQSRVCTATGRLSLVWLPVAGGIR